MTRWFNVAGPCKPDIHYMLPATARLPHVLRLIAQQSYFVLHAPRQTGKTTAMLALAQGAQDSLPYISPSWLTPSGGRDGVAVKPLTVSFHEGGFLNKSNSEKYPNL